MTTKTLSRTPLPRADIKHQFVVVYSAELNMFELRAITNKGKVSKAFAPQVAFTSDIREAFRKKFTVAFAPFRAVPGVDKGNCETWNEYIEKVWSQANQSLTAKNKNNENNKHLSEANQRSIHSSREL